MNEQHSKWQTKELAQIFSEGVRGAIPGANLQLKVINSFLRRKYYDEAAELGARKFRSLVTSTPFYISNSSPLAALVCAGLALAAGEAPRRVG